MDREKLLKQFTIRLIARQIFVSSVLFIWMYAFVYGIIDAALWIKSGIVLIIVSAVLGYISQKIYGEKDRARLLRIMPLIISIKDTPETLKKEKKILSAIDLRCFVIGFSFRDFSVIFIIIMSLSSFFRELERITEGKIKYLESKPEGL